MHINMEVLKWINKENKKRKPQRNEHADNNLLLERKISKYRFKTSVKLDHFKTLISES